jgi:hypothetical protein
VQRADAAGMAGAPGFKEVQGLGPAHLADRNTVGPKPKGGTDEVGQRSCAVLGAQRYKVWRGALQLARILDQHHPVAGLGDLGEQRVDQRGLAGRGAAGDEDVLAFPDRLQQLRLSDTWLGYGARTSSHPRPAPPVIL